MRSPACANRNILDLDYIAPRRCLCAPFQLANLAGDRLLSCYSIRRGFIPARPELKYTGRAIQHGGLRCLSRQLASL